MILRPTDCLFRRSTIRSLEQIPLKTDMNVYSDFKIAWIQFLYAHSKNRMNYVTAASSVHLYVCPLLTFHFQTTPTVYIRSSWGFAPMILTEVGPTALYFRFKPIYIRINPPRFHPVKEKSPCKNCNWFLFRLHSGKIL